MDTNYYNINNEIIKNWDKNILFEILDNIQDVVMIVDKDTTILYTNKAYSKILGVPADKILGKKLDEIEPDAIAIRSMRTGLPLYHEVDYLKSLKIDTVGISFPIFDNKSIIGGVSIFNNLTEIVKLSEELQRSKEMNNYFKEQLEDNQLPKSFKEYTSLNKELKKVLHLAAKVAITDTSVMIRGESGVGKEVLATAIHNSSKRSDKTIIKLNCASIPENLLESELFGYEDGAFTGAKKGGKIGKFELADGGTIFLDEIGDMSFNMQAKLLRVLQEREIERIGGTKTIPIDIRIIAATNRNLEEMIKEGTFREDLYYRLNVVPLNLLPLRERPEDIAILARSILKKLTKSDDFPSFSPQVIKIFQSHNWPGNIRELQNVLEHALILKSGNEINVDDLPTYLKPENTNNETNTKCTSDLKSTLESIEKEIILECLKKNNNNKSSAIRELGISRRTFYEKIKHYNLSSEEDKN